MYRIIIAIVVMTAATQFTRAFPFLLFSKRKPPQWLLSGARLIPGAVMTVLVLTSLPLNIGELSDGGWMPWAGAAVVTVLHLLFRHPLVSIFGGTAVYMLLLNFM